MFEFVVKWNYPSLFKPDNALNIELWATTSISGTFKNNADVLIIILNLRRVILWRVAETTSIFWWEFVLTIHEKYKTDSLIT